MVTKKAMKKKVKNILDRCIGKLLTGTDRSYLIGILKHIQGGSKNQPMTHQS